MAKSITSIAAEIALELNSTVGGNVTNALNQFEGSIYNIKDEYKTKYYPRIEGKGYYDIPDDFTAENVLWDDIRSVWIKDDNGDFQEAKKITDRSYKDDGAYYWNNNNKICIPPPSKTDSYYTKSDMVVLEAASYIYTGNYEFTSNTIKGNFPYKEGMLITVIGMNGGEYIIESITSAAIVLENASFTIGTYVVTMIGAAVVLSNANISDIAIGDYFAIRYNCSLVGSVSEYVDYYVKCTYFKALTASSVISYAYGVAIDSTRKELYGFGAAQPLAVFVPGIRITYKVPFIKKASDSTAPLLLPDSWSEPYNYFIASKIHEAQKDYNAAKYKRDMAYRLVAQYEESYNKEEPSFPADDMIKSTW